MLRRSLLVAVLLLSAQVARGQIIDSGRRGFREPEVWTSLYAGYLQQGGLCDPGTNACWDFGSALQWRATLEFPVGSGATIGGAATTARVPLVYDDASGCASGCDADANVSQYLALLHIGGGSRLHQAIDLTAGATVFTNFRSTAGGRLGGKAVTNFSFGVAYGFAYPVKPSLHLTLLQEYGLIVGKRMPNVARNTAEQITTRVGARLALGGRR